MAERRITDGGRELRTYLDRIETSVPDWCEEHGIDRIQVQRVLNGERWQRIPVDFAKLIQDATTGVVRWESFLSCTAAKPKAKSVRAKSASRAA